MLTRTMGSLPSIGSWEWYAHIAYDAHQKAEFEKAIENLTKALKLAPKEWRYQLLRNRGQAYQHIRRWDDALNDFWNMRHRDGRELASHIYLLRGDYKRGLELNEERVIFPQPNWDPRRTADDIRGKHVELFEEGGFGDTIQMLRFIPLVHSIAKSVTFVPRDPLAALVGELRGEGPVDVQVAMFDLMTIAGMREKGEAVLTGDPFLRSIHGIQVGASFETKVGLNWRGDSRHMTDPWRDVPLDQLLVLVKRHPEFKFVSLQHGLTTGERALLAGHKVEYFEPENFAEYADLLVQVDAFVTMDSAPAHLAGALGVKTYLMHAPRFEHRWGFKETTPWYNSMTILRGKKYGEWSDVIDEISSRLRG